MTVATTFGMTSTYIVFSLRSTQGGLFTPSVKGALTCADAGVG